MASAPSLRRLAVIAAILFVSILALLAGRVKAGADPAQPVSAPTPAVQQQQQQPSEQDPYGVPDPYGSGPRGVPGGGDQDGGSAEPGVSPQTQAS